MTAEWSKPLGRAVERLSHPLMRLALLGLGLGGAGFALLGVTPGSSAKPQEAASPWALPEARPALSDAAAILATNPVWASQPAAAAGAVVVQVPPRLVGVVKASAGSRSALLQWPDGRQQRVGVGDAIPGEGRMIDITATTARWRREDGTRVEAQLFSNQEPRIVENDDAPANDE
jgi:hypothetical protein